MKKPIIHKRKLSLHTLLWIFLCVISSPLTASADGMTHAMVVRVDPVAGSIEVEDTIHLSAPTDRVDFVLNAGFVVSAKDATLQTLQTSQDDTRTAYRASLQTASTSLKLHYHGKPRFSTQQKLGDMPSGIISSQMVYLDAAAAWYPLGEHPVSHMTLSVALPDGWLSLSNGRRAVEGSLQHWTSDTPQDELYLIAGRFTRYAQVHNNIDLSVWLLEQDAELAQMYLGLMGSYIDHYSELIGRYPYPKFAVVENPWQTGYGMPSFTLLGSRVIRLPFIPYTSLPHEILHNWWGNGVWVDYAAGNWSEGLTAYLADHWMQEREGKDDQYRLKALQRYSNFAAQGDDQPLLNFVARHNEASQSVGYSKGMMLFHMLRQRLGDAEFVAGLRRLWQHYRFQRIGFVTALRAIAGNDSLTDTMLPWLKRTGAPDLELTAAEANPIDDGRWRLRLQLSQGPAQPFALDLPVYVTLAGEDVAHRLDLAMDAPTLTREFTFDRQPLRVDVDPAFDVMRLLDPSEQPPALNRLFGAADTLVIVPAAADPAQRRAWEGMIAAWRDLYPNLELVSDDSDAARRGRDRNRLLLGWDNALLPAALAGFSAQQQTLRRNGILIDGADYPAERNAVVLVSSSSSGVMTGFIGADSPSLIGALARKLPHYGSFGRLVFDADGANLRRDTLPSRFSRLSRLLVDRDVPLHLPPRPLLGSEIPADAAAAGVRPTTSAK